MNVICITSIYWLSCEHGAAGVCDLDFSSFGQILGSGIASSYGCSVSASLRNHRAVFPGGCAILHLHPQPTSVPFSPNPHQHCYLLLSFSYNTYPDRGEVMSHCGFELHFPDN